MMKLRGYTPGFDAYMMGYRHVIVVLTNEPGDGWDIAEYLKSKGFADATVLTSRSAEKILKTYESVLKEVNKISERARTFVDIIQDNTIFEWNGRYLVPITYDQAKKGKYLFGHVIRIYTVR